MTRERIVVAMTGASGAPYGLRLLHHLARMGHPFDFVISPSAAKVLHQEVGEGPWFDAQNLPVGASFGIEGADVRIFAHNDIAAPIASGTALRRGMIILPCSMGTLGRIAHGISGNLVERAADVCLKERRRLVLAPRETPLSLVHLRNMTTLTEAGAMILPCAPGFYLDPQSIEDLLDHIVAKALDALDITHDVGRRWGS